MSHRNAKLTPAGRLTLIRQIEGGFSQADVARRMSLSRSTIAKWWKRYREEGIAGLQDRSSRAKRLDTGLAYCWLSNGASLAKGIGFPANPPCFHRDHVRMYNVPSATALGTVTFGTPHRETFTGAGHSVYSWSAAMDRLFNSYTSYPFAN